MRSSSPASWRCSRTIRAASSTASSTPSRPSKPMRACAGRVLLLFAFLLAQQTALAHAISHAADSEYKNSAGTKTGNPLCEQHAALGTVLGALGGARALASSAVPARLHFPAADSQAACLPVLPPASRGPPRLS